jgi:chemotaxis protein methyltransferase CheR
MSATQEATIAPREFKVVQRMIYDLAGIALSDSKQIMVQSRLAKRLREHNMFSYAEYLDLLQKDPDSEEMVRFINALTTNKTDFFRENHHFQFLSTNLFPSLKEQGEASGVRKLRIWCSASSTGEEPYSIAIAVRQFFGLDTDWDIRILASDIDTDVLKYASSGVYPSDRFAEMPSPTQKQFFDRMSRSENADWSAKSTLRDLITFRRINLQDEWPINTSFDIIFCRNVMIYFDSATQKKLVERFREKLTVDGHLIIGHSESLFGLSNQFKSLGETIYQKVNSETVASKGRSTEVASSPQDLNRIIETKSASLATSNQIPQRRETRASQVVVPRAPKPLQEAVSDPKFPIIVGEVRASSRPEWITTLLGSCVATCLYDDVNHVGGMNHFMLPSSDCKPFESASYGVHAMEILINRIMNAGGERRYLKAKIFGGGNVIRTGQQWDIGANNIAFAKQFLETEGFPLVASYTGGNVGMQIQFHTHSAKVLVRLLDQAITQSLIHKEESLSSSICINASRPIEVTLF